MQSRQRYKALHAVEPKCEISVVFSEPQSGHGTLIFESKVLHVRVE